MFVPFKEISPDSRLWIYQSNRKLTSQENTIIADNLKLFIDQWDAHGQPLKASFDIFHNQFIVLVADEAYHATSGCSIDASVHAIKEVEQQVGIQLFDRSQVAFKIGNLISICALAELKQKYLEGVWNESTLTFNNLITVKGQLDNEWIVPAGNTWLKRYAPSIKVAP
jgi:hypothetical protein